MEMKGGLESNNSDLIKANSECAVEIHQKWFLLEHTSELRTATKIYQHVSSCKI